MAVWQYQLSVIPKEAVIKKYGEIPSALVIENKKWEEYWENITDIENLPEPNFEDAKTIKWWENIDLNIRKASEQIDKLVTRANWGQDSLNSINWKGDSNKNEDNDCYISFDQKTKVINEFNFRTDLRNKEKAKKFIIGMLDFCNENKLMVFNTKGFLFEPKPEIIYEDLKKSNAIDFLTAPEKFLDKIAEIENKKKLKKLSLWQRFMNSVK